MIYNYAITHIKCYTYIIYYMIYIIVHVIACILNDKLILKRNDKLYIKISKTKIKVSMSSFFL